MAARKKAAPKKAAPKKPAAPRKRGKRDWFHYPYAPQPWDVGAFHMERPTEDGPVTLTFTVHAIDGAGKPAGTQIRKEISDETYATDLAAFFREAADAYESLAV